MALTTSTEDIIERRESNPVATACIILATVALLAAITLQLIEIGEQTRDLGQADRESLAQGRYAQVVAAELKKERDRVEQVLSENVVLATDVETYEEIIGDPAVVERIRSEHLGAKEGEEASDDGGAADDEDSEPTEE